MAHGDDRYGSSRYEEASAVLPFMVREPHHERGKNYHERGSGGVGEREGLPK
jgi:hypothetical protein